MDKQQTLELWQACEDARAKAKEDGKSDGEAHDAAEAVWNAWVDQVLAKKGDAETPSADWQAKAKVDFTGHTFENRAIFSSFRFPGEARFNDVKFIKEAKFERSMFEGHAEFEAATFGGDAEFVESIFIKKAGFGKTTFKKNTWFVEAMFGGNAWFGGVEFGGGTGFGGSTFKQEAGFGKTTFGEDAGFVTVRFDGAAEFGMATFKKDARFGKATFGGDAWFGKATFIGDAWFGNVTFKKSVRFEDALFFGDARFGETRFGGISYFKNAEFKEKAWFGKAEFNENVEFRDARFLGDAWLDDVTFSEHAIFDNATFGDDVWFPFSQFNGFVGFKAATFEKSASFDAAQISSAFSLANAKFFEVPNFTQAHFEEAPQLDKIDIERGSIEPHGFWPSLVMTPEDFVSPRYRALKRIANQAHHHDLEQCYFASELRARRNVKDKWWQPAWWFGVFYEVLSDFGRSLWLPVAYWLVCSCLFTTCYLTVHLRLSPAQEFQSTTAWIFNSVASWLKSLLPEGFVAKLPWLSAVEPSGNLTCIYDQFGSSVSPVWSALTISLQKGLFFFGLGNAEKVSQSYACLYGIHDGLIDKVKSPHLILNIPDRVAYLGLAQTLISLVLLFLFLLAVRNHFRLR